MGLGRTPPSQGGRSRNKVAVGEPAAGSPPASIGRKAGRFAGGLSGLSTLPESGGWGVGTSPSFASMQHGSQQAPV